MERHLARSQIKILFLQRQTYAKGSPLNEARRKYCKMVRRINNLSIGANGLFACGYSRRRTRFTDGAAVTANVNIFRLGTTLIAARPATCRLHVINRPEAADLSAPTFMKFTSADCVRKKKS
ncbi:hypothetical protein EVAR_2878_1 [Eumeta japonica]|uniref:Uncharacterized protein n=1 Tax=Eumeta variegata TaxID=151549 RepID=A0A4C1T3N6_EUMVA|nr:hypothetical protein EVAR_2878_1 [Eumeta japonica]